MGTFSDSITLLVKSCWNIDNRYIFSLYGNTFLVKFTDQNHTFSILPSHNRSLQEYIIFQHFVSSFLLIQLKAKTIFNWLWRMSNLRFCTKMNTPHQGKKRWSVSEKSFLALFFSAWSAILLCIPSKWQPAFPKYYCIGWHSPDCAKLVSWAGQYAWHTCHLLAPDKDYEFWTQTHGTIAGNPICCAETHPGRR